VDTAIHSSDQERLCELLRQTREAAGLRQLDVTDASGMPQSFVSKYESGERRLDLVELVEHSEGNVRADVVHERLVAMGFTGDERRTRRAVAEVTLDEGRSDSASGPRAA
jgi:transcriptional regulator with XRE-family HTH domain